MDAVSCRICCGGRGWRISWVRKREEEEQGEEKRRKDEEDRDMVKAIILSLFVQGDFKAGIT